MREAVCWRAIELTFEGSGEHRNPYLDVQVDVIFRGPRGLEILRPAFWDGDRTWRVRFAPTRPGHWRYEVRSAEDAALDGAHGALLATDARGPGAVHHRGFLRRSADGRHLEHADGTPFFWLGDTHWRFTTEHWDAANKPGWHSWFRGSVDKRVGQGFTVYQANLMLFDWGATDSRYFLPGGLFEQPDLAFFREVVDPRMAYLAERGLVVALGLGWHQAVDENLDGVRRFAREVVARYGAYPVVWTLGGEVAGYKPALRPNRIDRWRQVARTIQSTDGYDHPRTAHSTTEQPLAPYYQGEDWLTFTLNQHGHGDRDLSTVHYRDYFAAHPATPLVEGESFYEGLTSVEYAGRRTVTDAMVRHVAYRAFQSGCCGYSYGAQGCWNGALEWAEHATTWGDLPWYEGIDLPGGEQMGHLRRFYESLPWTQLRPAPCLSSGSGINDAFYRPDVSADASRSTVVLFFSETYHRGVGHAEVFGTQAVPYSVRWFDPRTGVAHRAPDALPVGGRLGVPDKPDDRDWLLVLQTVPPTTARNRI